MNRRIRRQSTFKKSDDGYLRYLKPGALAQLRDSKINARSHHRSSDSQIYLYRTSLSPTSSPSRSPSAAGVSQQQQEEATGTIANVDGGFPCFYGRFYGTRCPQRKRLVAAKSMYCLNPNPNTPITDGPEPVIDVFSTDFLVAH